MLTNNTEFFKALPDKQCSVCNDVLVEMADCYATVCEKCAGSVFFPLSPLAASTKPAP